MFDFGGDPPAPEGPLRSAANAVLCDFLAAGKLWRELAALS